MLYYVDDETPVVPPPNMPVFDEVSTCNAADSIDTMDTDQYVESQSSSEEDCISGNNYTELKLALHNLKLQFWHDSKLCKFGLLVAKLEPN